MFYLSQYTITQFTLFLQMAMYCLLNKVDTIMTCAAAVKGYMEKRVWRECHETMWHIIEWSEKLIASRAKAYGHSIACSKIHRHWRPGPADFKPCKMPRSKACRACEKLSIYACFIIKKQISGDIQYIILYKTPNISSIYEV
jgi:hypothetical protein